MANASTYTLTPITPTTPTDPSLCRISGQVRRANGTPLAGVALKIRLVYTPEGIVPDTLIAQEEMSVSSNKEGKIQVDLVRGVSVRIQITNRTPDLSLVRTVPDVDQIDLVDFLFPYMVLAEFDDTSPVTVAVGERRTFTLTATLSDGSEVALTTEQLDLASGDEAILRKVDGNTFEALQAGTVQLSVTAVRSSGLGLLQRADGAEFTLLAQPDVILPADLTVEVS